MNWLILTFILIEMGDGCVSWVTEFNVYIKVLYIGDGKYV